MADSMKPAAARRPIAEFRRAASFFTCIPIGGDAGPLTAASWAFPVVGAGIGAVGGGLLLLAIAAGIPPVAAAFISVGAVAVLTGGLHEDGLADTADGFGGGHSTHRKLEIMRDSHIGTFGVLALVLVVGLRVVLFAELSSAAETFAIIVTAAALSRAVLPVVMQIFPAASSNGLAAAAGKPGWLNAVLGLAAAAAIGIALLPIWPLMASLLATLAAAAMMSGLARHHISGYNGDTLGATQQIAEISMLLTAAVLFGRGIL